MNKRVGWGGLVEGGLVGKGRSLVQVYHLVLDKRFLWVGTREVMLMTTIVQVCQQVLGWIFRSEGKREVGSSGSQSKFVIELWVRFFCGYGRGWLWVRGHCSVLWGTLLLSFCKTFLHQIS